MYLTRLFLDATKRETMKALSCPAHFHGAIELAFSGERQRPLWRLDTYGDAYCLLILSQAIPDLSRVQAQFGTKSQPWETKEYSQLLNRITDGSIWRFRLTANPTYSKLSPGKRGTVCAHTTPAHQIQWLLRQAGKYGFEVSEDSSRISSSRWLQFYKGNEGNRRVTILSVTYDGTLRVNNTERFIAALTEGIGRGKAYGMGLMTLVHCHA